MAFNGGEIQGASTNVAITYATATSPTGCLTLRLNNSMSNVLIDHDRFDRIRANTSGNCVYEGRIQVWGGASSIAAKISNTHFGGEATDGCSDGIQSDNTGGLQIGPGNEFTGLSQNICPDGTHTDPIQMMHSNSGNVIVGNYFHDNGDGSGGCMCSGASMPAPINVTVKNNVFASTGYPYSILAGGGETGWTISHNVFFEMAKMDNYSPNGSGNVMRDNVWVTGAGGARDAGSGVSYDHNLNSGKAGTGNISGTQVFVSSPSSGYYHYQLDSTSPGYHAASDGKSIGISP
jgi:hypothetical protein